MTTIGVDIASVDANRDIDWHKAKAAGIRFAILRGIYGRSVTDGSTAPFRDPVWIQQRAAVLDAGLKRSAYLFVCYPQHNKFTPPPEEQADAFAAYVHDLVPFIDMVPFFDVEETSDILSPEEMYSWTLRVAQRLRDHFEAWPGMYTSARVWAENLDHHSPGPLLACPLWLAKPWPWAARTQIHLDGAPTYSPTLIPEWGSQWFTYQYQGDAIGCPGFSSTVDANRIRVFGKGARGNHVAWVQKRCGGLTVDGIYGPATEAAVMAIQRAHNLDDDGIVGLDTFTVLGWCNPDPA